MRSDLFSHVKHSNAQRISNQSAICYGRWTMDETCSFSKVFLVFCSRINFSTADLRARRARRCSSVSYGTCLTTFGFVDLPKYNGSILISDGDFFFLGNASSSPSSGISVFDFLDRFVVLPPKRTTT
jgi:hypothetical protein